MSPPKLAVGVLFVGSAAAFGQVPAGRVAPYTLPAPAVPTAACTTPACGPAPSAHAKGGFGGRLRAWLTPIEVPQVQPFGLTVTSHFAGHVQAGSVARMVFHDYDFRADSGELNYRGVDRLREVALLMRENAEPVVIERLPRDPALAEQRRLAVATALSRIDPQLHPSRVVVAAPVSYPLSGTDAITIHQTQNQLTASTGYLPSNTQGGGIGSGLTTPNNGGQSPGSNTPTGR